MHTPLRRIILPLAVGLALGALLAVTLHLQPHRAIAQTDPFAKPPREPANRPTPVVVELFTSEGCSSCPPADDLLADLVIQQPVKGARVLALGLHVDYWNDLGWVDRFSDRKFTDRQRAYARAFGSDRVYTPQMVVDGSFEFVGSDRERALTAIETAARRPHLPVSIEVESRAPEASSRRIRVRVESLDALKSRDADVVLAISEDQLDTDVERGENAGRHLDHLTVVRTLERLADSLGDEPAAEFSTTIELDPDWDARRLSATAFVQLHDGNRIVGAAQTPLTVVSVPGPPG